MSRSVLSHAACSKYTGPAAQRERHDGAFDVLQDRRHLHIAVDQLLHLGVHQGKQLRLGHDATTEDDPLA
jgi:hypothetical protein